MTQYEQWLEAMDAWWGRTQETIASHLAELEATYARRRSRLSSLRAWMAVASPGEVEALHRRAQEIHARPRRVGTESRSREGDILAEIEAEEHETAVLVDRSFKADDQRDLIEMEFAEDDYQGDG